MNYANNPERERVLNLALQARALPDVALATRELDQWVDTHPNDLGILDAYEVLENMREIAEFQQAERKQRMLTEQAA